MLEATHHNPPRHYFKFNYCCTIYTYTTYWMRISCYLVSKVVHCLLNTVFAAVKVGVASGVERPHYY